MKTLFTHPQETWSVAQCEKAAKKINRDGLGTVGGPLGLVSHSGSYHCQLGQTKRYNGGFIAPDGEHYASEHKPLPKVPDGFRFEPVTSWGIRIVKS
jgi:hypothetical protein